MPENNTRRARTALPRAPKKRTVGLSAMIALIGFIVWYVNSGRAPEPLPDLHTAPESLGSISIEGVGGDRELNIKKNRFTEPSSLADLSVGQVIALPSAILQVEGKFRRAEWSASAREYLEKEESRGVRVTGYLLRAKESGPESCNGNVDSLRDYHVWLSDSPTGERSGAMIVEVTPRWKIVHPEWRLHYLQRLAQERALVRVTGWLLWDEEHADEVDRSRGTQWEVHPITNLEVLSGGAWQSANIP